MLEYWQKGGIVMWPLLACAVTGLAFIIERLITYALAAANPRALVMKIRNAYDSGGSEKAMEVCDRSRSPVARILAVALRKHASLTGRAGSPNPAAPAVLSRTELRREIEDAVSMSGATELAFLDRGMLPLAAVSTLGPIFGFLGTVTGMIRAFDAISIAGEVEPTLVASGISEALITTAAGLFIAAPAVAFHVYFTQKMNAYTRNMEAAANDMIDYLLEKS